MNRYELFDLAKLALRVLSEKKVRSILTIIGIAIGPTALVAVLGVVEGYSNYVINQIQGLGQDFIIVIPHSSYTLTHNDIAMIKSMPEVKYITPFYSARVRIMRGGKYIDATVYAVNLKIFFHALKKLKVTKGDIPSPNDAIGAVIGRFIAYDEKGIEYYDVNDVLSLKYYVLRQGKITTKTVNVVVRGILAEFGNAFFVNPDTTVFLPLTAGRRLFGFSKWSGLIIIVKNPVYVEKVTNRLRDIYGEKAAVVSLIEISRVVSSITAAMKFVTTAAGSAAFIVAITGIAASMITSIMERTREIGVMKAIGFTNTEIMVAILMESIIMSIIGAVIGIVLGLIGAYILAGQGMTIHGAEAFTIKAPPRITPTLLGGSFIITVIVGAIGGLVPAYQAARIPPAVALRYE